MSTKFFFDFADNGSLTVDETGLQYPTRAAARYAAVSALQSVMRDLVLNQQSRWELSVKVRDESSSFFEAKMAFEIQLCPAAINNQPFNENAADQWVANPIG